MAYAQSTPTITRGAGGEFLVEYTETDVQAASEATVESLPTFGRIVMYKATKTAGSAATIAPEGGTSAAWTDSTQAEIMSGPTAAAFIHETQTLFYYTSTGTLYFRATPNTGSDNAVSTQIAILEGWGD